MSSIEVKNIEKHFGKNGLDRVSFSLDKGDLLCLTGGSGCGKTTLLNIISGMLRPDGGELLIDGKNIFTQLNERERTKLRSGRIGYMMQGNVLIPELTIADNIRMPAELNGGSVSGSELQELLERLNIANVAGSYPSEVSGGEYRRAALARTLLLHPYILLADEPTSDLDGESAGIVREILREYADSSHILIAATHDPLLAGMALKSIKISPIGSAYSKL